VANALRKDGFGAAGLAWVLGERSTRSRR